MADVGYLTLADQVFHPGEPQADAGLMVRGRRREGGFEPEGDVQGEGEFNGPGQAGWLELATCEFVSAQTARPPRSPYVEGFCDTGSKRFTPSGRRVIY